jgi:hypothetical protein
MTQISHFEEYKNEVYYATAKFIEGDKELDVKSSVAGMFYTLLLEGREDEISAAFKEYFPEYYLTTTK